MSFNADHLLAARNLTYADLIPYNAEHERLADDLLRQVMPEDLGEAYTRLAFLASQAQNGDTPHDDCLHCWISGSGPSGFISYRGKRQLMASDADTTDPLLLAMRRIAMFDVPRRLFAEDHGIWVYWLYAGVFVLSPQRQVNLDWAFRRHAFRLEWRLTGTQPARERPAQDARAYVLAYLEDTAAQGLAHIRAELQRPHPLDIFNVPVNGPLFEPVSAWLGSLTGAELLRQHLGLTERLTTYNCCGGGMPQPANPQSGKPSSVRQLQNQSPERRDC